MQKKVTLIENNNINKSMLNGSNLHLNRNHENVLKKTFFNCLRNI